MKQTNELWKGVGKYCFLFFIAFFPFIFLLYTNQGEFTISDMYLANCSKDGACLCDECLWIEFDEGCNHVQTYFFEGQHELDERLKVGMPVDIYRKKCARYGRCIYHVQPRHFYNDGRCYNP